MKNLVVLYGGDLSSHAFEKVFDSECAFGRVLSWASKFSEKIVLFLKDNSSVSEQVSSIISQNSNIEVISHDCWTKSLFIQKIRVRERDCFLCRHSVLKRKAHF